MAEIRVEPRKRSMLWLWLILLIAIVAAAVWYFNNNGRNDVPAAATSLGSAPVSVVTS